MGQQQNAFEINPGVAEVGESAHQKLLDDSMKMPDGLGSNSLENGAQRAEAAGKDTGKVDDLDKEGSAGIINEHMQEKDGEAAEGAESFRDFIDRFEKNGKGDGSNDFSEDFFKKLNPSKITPEERSEAKQELQDMIPKIVGDGDRKAMVSLQESVIDGNVEKLGSALESLRKDPERMGRFIDELNTQLKKSGSDTRLTQAEDGRVFLHNEGGDLAVQFNKDGSTEVKSVDYTRSGAMVVNPGEVVGRSAGDVASDIGDQTVRDMRYQAPIHKLPDFRVIPKDGELKPREWLQELKGEAGAGAGIPNLRIEEKD